MVAVLGMSRTLAETKALQAEARRLHDSGLGYRRIAKALGQGVTSNQVGKWMRGGQPRPRRSSGPRAKNYARRALLHAMAVAGFTLKEMAAELDSTPNAVGGGLSLLRREGVPAPFLSNAGCRR